MSSVEGSAGKNNPATGSTVTGDDSSEKMSWPELVGESVEEAKRVILKDKPKAKIVVVPAGSTVTKDYRTDRVRLFIDTVAEVPMVG